MGTPIGKRTDGSVLRHMGKPIGKTTHRRTINAENLAGRLKDTNPYPWRDPKRGGGASHRLHKGAAAFGGLHPFNLCGFIYMGLSMGTVCGSDRIRFMFFMIASQK